MDTPRERRRHPRIDAVLRFDVLGDCKGWRYDVVNVSEGGLRFRTDTVYLPGSDVNIDIIPDEQSGLSSLFKVKSRIVRISRAQAGLEVSGVSYEVAVEFTEIDDDCKRAINRLVSVSH